MKDFKYSVNPTGDWKKTPSLDGWHVPKFWPYRGNVLGSLKEPPVAWSQSPDKAFATVNFKAIFSPK